MSELAIRHYLDDRHVFNGSRGNWTVCGLPWTGEPDGIATDCAACADETRKHRQEQRIQCGSAPRLVP